MLRPERIVTILGNRPTERRWKRLSQFQLRTFLLAVSVVCISLWLVPTLYDLFVPLDLEEFFALPRATHVAEWKGTIPLVDVAKAQRAGQVVADQKRWEELWAVPLPENPFEELIL